MEETRQNFLQHTGSRSRGKLYRGGPAVVGAVALAFLLAGCETGRTNKAHAGWQHLSDDTTTGKPESKQALSPGEHHPPVPGSPTAAGPDGNQPADDMQAASRREESSEAAAPH